MRTTCANMSLKIINKSTCLSLPIGLPTLIFDLSLSFSVSATLWSKVVLKGSKHQPLVYEDERSVRLLLGTVVTPTIHSFCKRLVWRNSKVGNYIYTNFSFPHDMEAQGTIQFMELKGQVYPALVREFYANFRYKDGKYWSMISGNLFELNDEIFMNVGGLSSSGYSIGDCSWVKENFDPTEVYKGQLTKAGSLSVENRLLHYIIAYILVQRNTNHAQPTVNDLRFMYAVKNNVMINWPEEILKIMNIEAASLQYLHITASLTICALTFPILSLLNIPTRIIWLVKASYIRWVYTSMVVLGNTKRTTPLLVWIYLMMIIRMTQIISMPTAQGEPSGSAPQKSAFGFDQLEAMEQRLNNRMDLHFQGLKDSYFAGMEQYEERQTAYSDNQFRELRSLIQSTAEAQNALFCSEFQKLSMLIRGDQNIVTSVDHTDDPHPPPQP
ncbi:hypothetical protein Lal_00032872 [Lupinus albus]|nr:hypothetical protein Lal_00032872 [Lupinus albus]